MDFWVSSFVLFAVKMSYDLKLFNWDEPVLVLWKNALIRPSVFTSNDKMGAITFVFSSSPGVSATVLGIFSRTSSLSPCNNKQNAKNPKPMIQK